MDAYKAVKEKDVRLQDLQRRRKQLAALLAEEREQLHVSLYLTVADSFDCTCAPSLIRMRS